MTSYQTRRVRLFILLAVTALVIGVLSPALNFPIHAEGTPQPNSVTLVGSLAVALGCTSDAQLDCDKAKLTFNEGNQLWQATFDVPAGEYTYAAVLDGSADKKFGAGGASGGNLIPLKVDANGKVSFVFDMATGYLADNVNRIFANVPGDYQMKIGCAGDWAPDCWRSLLEDPDGDGTYIFSTKLLPQGDYQAKVALNGTWDVNYGGNGAAGGSNIAFSVPTDNVNIIFTWDSKTKIMDISVEGAPKGNLKLAQADWISSDTIAWPSGRIKPDAKFALHFDPTGAMTLDTTGLKGGTEIPLTYDIGGLSEAQKTQFPYLASATTLKLPADALSQIPQILKGQVVVTATDASGAILDSTALQIPGVIDELYRYDGDLGVSVEAGVPTLRVWAPTATDVKVQIFDDGNRASQPTTTAPMIADPKTGMWSVVGESGWMGKYYLYEVHVFVRSTGKVETNLVTDPYSVSLSTDSLRSQIVDLNDPALRPEGWDTLQKPTLKAFEDIVLYELHIRDFSIYDESVPEEYRGKFVAFTETNSNGMKHLAELAKAGLTHIHLLPAFDIATISENPADRREPDLAKLKAAAPDAQTQQVQVATLRNKDGFNWGYDPFHYSVPEGSYATDPEGSKRIVEFREMVQSLNKTGLRVVMDVVYNHTNASGENIKSVLDQIVPGYYHRLNADGNVEQSTCCENTATEHHMMEKLMIDSVVMWAKQYKVDGFRFDLMGHHMVSNMVALRKALDALTMEKDGVDGKLIYVYGEGWDFGEVANNQRGVNATQKNLAGTGIGTFSDRLRDGVRGGGPFDDVRVQGFASGLLTDPNAYDKQGTQDEQTGRLLNYEEWIKLGLAGNLKDYKLVNAKGELVTGDQIDYKGQPAGYTLDPQENIVYVSAHDNETLYDALAEKLPANLPLADRIRMDSLALSTVLLAQGVPFIHAGDDILRSKSMDRDSYDSGDWYNAIDWTLNDNGWGHGLPLSGKNKDLWPVMQPLLANPALKPAQADIQGATAVFQDFLRIRQSSPLFRLQTAQQVMDRVSFLSVDTPGVIAYVIDDSKADTLDANYSQIVVIFNATPSEQKVTSDTLKGSTFTLHPVQANGSDAVVKQAAYDAGTFTVPARTTAVFVVTR